MALSLSQNLKRRVKKLPVPSLLNPKVQKALENNTKALFLDLLSYPPEVSPSLFGCTFFTI
jgi:hypothetical protein